jgi:hypothetical protein
MENIFLRDASAALLPEPVAPSTMTFREGFMLFGMFRSKMLHHQTRNPLDALAANGTGLELQGPSPAIKPYHCTSSEGCEGPVAF